MESFHIPAAPHIAWLEHKLDAIRQSDFYWAAI